jgi:hypothetical protein
MPKPISMHVDQLQKAEIGALRRYRPWFYAAAAYNLAWGLTNALFPALIFDLLGLDAPNYLPLWQVVAMFVLVYSPAYWWVARFPERFPHFIAIGLLGKVLGPAGFLASVLFADFPLIFGLTILTNDLIWYPAFVSYLREAARQHGGWTSFLSGQ